MAILLPVFVFLAGCNQKKPSRDIERSFYYWKSIFKPTAPGKKALNDLHIKLLYVKFFDITWNKEKNKCMPAAIVKFPPTEDHAAYSIIPTIFITNECMQNMPPEQLTPLAANILALVKNITSTNNIAAVPEIQVDCDWNAGTKDNYFLLLQTMKSLVAAEKMELSATIRLHQYKFRKKMGVPPVNRGLLMCYNMGNLKSMYTRNSILDTKELENYLGGDPVYGLPLDLALPLFNWKVLFRNKNYAGLIRELPNTSLDNDLSVKRTGNNYEILQSHAVNGYRLEQGDLLRDEDISYEELKKAADILAGEIKTHKLRVVLYHLDSITLAKFSLHELETIFDRLR